MERKAWKIYGKERHGKYMEKEKHGKYMERKGMENIWKRKSMENIKNKGKNLKMVVRGLKEGG
jgi:hypothetical protein